LVYKNVLACYTHLHALGTPEWAAAMVRKAREYRRSEQEA
jgi:cobyrinic acid a,c-diamide synthase